MSDFFVNNDQSLTNINVSDTAYINSLVLNHDNTIIVPSGRYPTIQSAIDALASGGGTIKVARGVYNETLHLVGKPSAVAYGSTSGGLKIIGDSRYSAGLAYVNGGNQLVYTASVYSNFPPPFPPTIVSYNPPIGTYNGQVGFTAVGGSPTNSVQINIIQAPTSDPDDFFVLPGTIVQPDFPAVGVIVGDTVVIYDDTGAFSEARITAVSGNTITFSGPALSLVNKGSSITFCPNVQVLNNSHNINTFNVVNAGISIQGIRFKVGPSATNVHSNLFLCSSQVQPQGCVFDDFLTNQTEGNVMVTNGATLIGQDRFGGAEFGPGVVYDDTVITQNHNVLLGGGGAIDSDYGGQLKVVGATVSGGNWDCFNVSTTFGFCIGCFASSNFGVHSARTVGSQYGQLFEGSNGFYLTYFETYGFSYRGVYLYQSSLASWVSPCDIDALGIGFEGVDITSNSVIGLGVGFGARGAWDQTNYIQNCYLGVNCINNGRFLTEGDIQFSNNSYQNWVADQSGSINLINTRYYNEGWFYLATHPIAAFPVPLSGELDHVIENQVLFNQPSSGALHMTWNVDDPVMEGRTFRIKSFGQWDYWTITPVADVNGSLAGTYWTINTITPRSYTVWYKVSGVGTQPVVAGTTNYIEVDINTNDTAVTVATNTYNVLLAMTPTDVTLNLGSPLPESLGIKDIGDGLPATNVLCGEIACPGTSGFNLFHGFNDGFGNSQVFPPSNPYPHTVTLQNGYFYDTGIANANVATFAGTHSGEYFECVCSCICRVHILNSYGITFSSTL